MDAGFKTVRCGSAEVHEEKMIKEAENAAVKTLQIKVRGKGLENVRIISEEQAT